MPQESKFTVRRREFAEVIAKHFIRHHKQTKTIATFNQLLPQTVPFSKLLP